MTTINRSSAGILRRPAGSSVILAVLIVLALAAMALGIWQRANGSALARSPDAAIADQPAGYEPATETELARLRYEALQAQLAQRQSGSYDAATESEQARIRDDAFQAQLAARDTVVTSQQPYSAERQDDLKEQWLARGSESGTNSAERQEALKDRWLEQRGQ